MTENEILNLTNLSKEELKEIKEKYPKYEGKIGGNFKDISGKKRGKILPLYRGENEISPSGRPYVHYICLCDCGNVLSMRGDNLKQRPNSSCGHCKNFIFSQEKTYGTFNILEIFRSGADNREHVKLQCQKCGNVLTPKKTELYKENNIKCNRCGRNNYSEGDIIGDLTLKEFKIFDENVGIQWKCECKCGNILYLRTTDLQSRRTCGLCKKVDPEDIVGKSFGKLIVLKNLNYYIGGSRIYECQCKCGSIVKVSRSNLLTGHTSSCGCVRSKNEEIIGNILNQLNLFFEKNQIFNNCINISNLLFDFYVNNEYLIEYDGEQHFKYSGRGWNNKENFEKTHIRDLLKNKYCFDNNIPLIRIPYDAEYTIDDLKLETTRFLLTPENEQEYYSSRA